MAPRLLLVLVIALSQARAFAGDSSSASFIVSGVVPAIVSADIRMAPGALVFNPGERVRNRAIGSIDFRYNVQLAAILLSSDQPGGIPAGESGPYPFGPHGFTVSIGNCRGIDPGLTNPVRFSPVPGEPVDIGRKETLTTGVIQTCSLLASWDGASGPAPQAAAYSISYSLSLVPAQ